jgi:glyoxylase-like metal-dependent hydrolase (beta-lactamase superfamily II)
MRNDKTVRKYVSSGGTTVYKLPVEAFPNHVTNCYLVMTEPITLLDTGSGWDQSNRELAAGFEKIGEQFGEKLTLRDVDRVIVTHGHIDHFGGVNFVIQESAADLCIHELDASVIQHFRERLVYSSANVHLFLRRSGLPKERVAALVQMNKWSKDTFQSRPVEVMFSEGPVLGGPLEAFHVPGHCPGQVCLKLDDILFTADHVLSNITPNQSPESITRYTGVGHYMESLRKIRSVPGIRIGLGGHEDEMPELGARIDATLAFHDKRLNRTLELLDEPKTIAQTSMGLFGERMDYHILLAMLETGAHLEYLYEHGKLIVANIDAVEQDPTTVPLYWQP